MAYRCGSVSKEGGFEHVLAWTPIQLTRPDLFENRLRNHVMRSLKVLAVLAVSLFASKGVLAEEVIHSIAHGTNV